MKKNKVIVLVGIFIIIVLSLFILVFFKNKNNKTDKFYLEDKYYGSSEFIEIDNNEFKKIQNESYVLYIYNNFCNLPIPCHEIFEQYMKEKNIAFLSMKYEYFKETKLHDKVRFAPSVIIVKDGKIVDYLDAEKDEDLDKYQNIDEFSKWIENNIYNKR